ncbi:hypothetical protein EV175_003326 [Coemansia sp. RSA 1933]|nr:hypothetical protein EV175_003326 [Coemansia sp. RSA 1933]
MKFGKYLDAEQVPEWEKMYVNYRALKRLVKKIAVAKAIQMAGPSEEKTTLLRRASTYLGYSSTIIGNSSTNSSPTQTADIATINQSLAGLMSPEPCA